jgi:hypothetical protein
MSDDSTVPAVPWRSLTWTPFGPYQRALSGGYAYLVHAVRVPVIAEPAIKDETEYALRMVDPASLRAYGPRTTGYHHSQHYTVAAAMQEANEYAWKVAQGADRHVPKDYPAILMERFFWPISEGVSMGALAIVRDGDRLVARVVGMSRGRDDRYEPGTYVEVQLADYGDAPAELEEPS